jgi:hypothetical protein
MSPTIFVWRLHRGQVGHGAMSDAITGSTGDKLLAVAKNGSVVTSILKTTWQYW